MYDIEDELLKGCCVVVGREGGVWQSKIEVQHVINLEQGGDSYTPILAWNRARPPLYAHAVPLMQPMTEGGEDLDALGEAQTQYSVDLQPRVQITARVIYGAQQDKQFPLCDLRAATGVLRWECLTDRQACLLSRRNELGRGAALKLGVSAADIEVICEGMPRPPEATPER